jgi:hypothetical protein
LHYNSLFYGRPVLKARWSEDELKPHRGSALTAEGTAGTFPRAIGGAMKRFVFREDEARAGSTGRPSKSEMKKEMKSPDSISPYFVVVQLP